jgi:CRP/FNR family cyclic AMP-dependent transcriptional regulator
MRDIDFAALRALRDRFGAHYPRGKILFRAGELNTDFYVVLQGSVDIVTRSPDGTGRVIRTVGVGEFFGEAECFCDQPRAATTVVREDAVILTLNQAAINDLLSRSPKFARGVIQTLCDRIRSDTEQVVEARSSRPQA